jgi:hypothetical protein
LPQGVLLCFDGRTGCPPIHSPKLTMRKKFFCTFPNIRAASISDTMAMVAVEIDGEAGSIEQSIAYLRERGVKVEEMLDNEDLPNA